MRVFILLSFVFCSCTLNRHAARTDSAAASASVLPLRDTTPTETIKPPVIPNSRKADSISNHERSKLVVGFSSPVITLNPYAALDRESRQVCDLIYAGLIGTDNTLNLVPEMSASTPSAWNPIVNINKSDEPVELIVPLKLNVAWHPQGAHGEDILFRPEDVVKTYEYLRRHPTLPGASKISNIDNVISGGSDNVRIIFKKGQFTYRNLDFPILSRALVRSPDKMEAIGENPSTVSGTGPYRVTRWNKLTNEIDLVYADNGYLEHPPAIREIGIRVYTDEETRRQDLAKGNIDVVTDLPAVNSAQLRSDSAIKVLDYPSVELTAILFNYRAKKGVVSNPNFNLFRNKLFRRALDLAIDKDEIYRAVFQEGDRTVPLITGPFLPASGVYNASIARCKWREGGDYSVLDQQARQQEARRMIDKTQQITGATDVALEMIYLQRQEGASGDLNKQVARLLNFRFRALGVVLKMKGLPKDEFYARINAGDFDLALYEWTSGLVPSIAMWEPREENAQGVSLNPANLTGYEYAGRYASEYQKAAQTVKFGRGAPNEIRNAYHFIHEQLHEETAAIFLWNRSQHIAIRRSLQIALVSDPIDFIKSVKEWKRE